MDSYQRLNGNYQVPSNYNQDWVKLNGNLQLPNPKHNIKYLPYQNSFGYNHTQERKSWPEGDYNFPKDLPAEVKKRSTSSHAVIEWPLAKYDQEPSPYPQPESAVKEGSWDQPQLTTFTRGIQYYYPNVGVNPQILIAPVIIPRAYDMNHWAQESVTFPQVNKRYAEDITDIDIDYLPPQGDLIDHAPFFGIGLDSRGLYSEGLGVAPYKGYQTKHPQYNF